MRRQHHQQRLLFLLPLALGVACSLLHPSHAAPSTSSSSRSSSGYAGFIPTLSGSSRRPATAAAVSAAHPVALQPGGGSKGHDDDLSSSPSHVCHAWCGCARRRAGRTTMTGLWATKDEAEAEAPAAEEEEEEQEAAEEQQQEEEEEEEKDLTPEEKQKKELKAEIKELEAALAKKRNELTEAQDKLKTVGKEGYMRLAAEVETYKRRRADGLAFVRNEAAKEATKQLIPVLDLFEELEAKYAGVTEEASVNVLKGYRNLQAVFAGKAERLGLKAFAPAAGDAYDPTMMEAEFVVGDTDDVVLSLAAKGYEIGGRVVRRARVAVSVTEATMKAREGNEGEGDGAVEEEGEEGEGAAEEE